MNIFDNVKNMVENFFFDIDEGKSPEKFTLATKIVNADFTNASKTTAFYGDIAGHARLSENGEDLPILEDYETGSYFVVDPNTGYPLILIYA